MVVNVTVPFASQYGSVASQTFLRGIQTTALADVAAEEVRQGRVRTSGLARRDRARGGRGGAGRAERRGQLKCLVVMPPPPERGTFSEVGRLLSLPGTFVLLVSTAGAALLIFAPMRAGCRRWRRRHTGLAPEI